MPEAALAPGQEERQLLIGGGFNQDEIKQWETDTRAQLEGGGFSPKEIDGYFGTTQPDMTGVKNDVRKNLASYYGPQPMSVADQMGAAQTGHLNLLPAPVSSPPDASTLPSQTNPNTPMTVGEQVATALSSQTEKLPVKPFEAKPSVEYAYDANAPWEKNLGNALRSAFQSSTLNLNPLILNRPTVLMPEDAPSFYRIANQVGGFVFDTPAMFVGGAIGTLIAGPGPGTAAGAFAAPAAFRKWYTERLEKGDIRDARDFWERFSATFVEALNQGAIGAATAGTGALVGKAFQPGVLKSATVIATEIGTMVSLGKLLEHEFDQIKLTDFTDAALGVLFMHGVASGVRRIQAHTERAIPDRAVTHAEPGLPGAKPEVHGPQPQEVPTISEAQVDEARAAAASGQPPGEPPPPPAGGGLGKHDDATLEKLATERAPDIEQKLRDIYRYTGIVPRQVFEDAAADPLIREELLAPGRDLPSAYQELIPKEEQGPARLEPSEMGQDWFHGAGADFMHFDPEALGATTGAPSAKEGFFFTNNTHVAASYADMGSSPLAAEATRLQKQANQLAAKFNMTVSQFINLDPEDLKDMHKNMSLEEARSHLKQMKDILVKRTQVLRDSMEYGNATFSRKIVERLANEYDLSMETGDMTVTINGQPEAVEVTPANLVEFRGLSHNRAEEVAFNWNTHMQHLSEEPHLEIEGAAAAPVVYPVKLDMKNPMVFDMKGSHYREVSYYELIKEAKAKGHDGLIIKNTYDAGSTGGVSVPAHDVAVVFEPSQIVPKYERGLNAKLNEAIKGLGGRFEIEFTKEERDALFTLVKRLFGSEREVRTAKVETIPKETPKQIEAPKEFVPPEVDMSDVEYQGSGDVQELKGIGEQTAQAIENGDFTIDEAMDEVVPYEWNLDKSDLSYIRTYIERWLEASKAVLSSERGAVGLEEKQPQTDLEKAHAKIRERISPRYPDRTMREKFQGLIAKETRERAYEELVDDLDPWKSLVNSLYNGLPVTVKQSGYALGRLARAFGSKAEHFLTFGTFSYGDFTKSTGKSLKEILQPVMKFQKHFEEYLVSLRALELAGKRNVKGEPIETGVDLNAARTVVDAHPEWKQIAKDVVDYQNRVFRYLVDAGRMSEESYNKITNEHLHYVPFFRITEEADAIGGGKNSFFAAVKNRIFGSKSKIVSPIESMIRNTFEFIRLAENNRAALAILEAAEVEVEDENGFIKRVIPEETQHLIKRVSPPTEKIKVGPEDVAKYLRGLGFDVTPGTVEGFDIFRRYYDDLEPNQIVVYRNGKPEIYQVDESVARAFRNLDGNRPQLNLILRMLKPGAAILRGSLALTPDFNFRNLFRDQFSATTFSRYRNIPVFELYRAMGHIWREDKVWQDFLKSGGLAQGFVPVDQNYISNNVWGLHQETGFLNLSRNLVKTGWGKLHFAGKLLENATRVAEFKRVATEQGTKAVTHESLLEGGLAAREVTVDFERRGASHLIQIWNQITAFQNAQIQGLDRTARAFQDDPREATLRALTLVTLPSIALWAHNKDKQWYIDLPQWQKDTFWIFAVGGDDQHPDYIIRLPKPMELGLLFGTVPERLLEAFVARNPDAFKELRETVMNTILPPMAPNTLLAPYEHKQNKSEFTDRNLVPAELEGVLPEDQHRPYTTETAKLIGRVLAKIPVIGELGPKNTPLSSPMIVEHYWRSLLGNTGMMALHTVDWVLEKSGVIKDPQHAATPISRMPFFKAFMIMYPSADSQAIHKFYDNFQEHSRMIKSWDLATRSQDVERMKELQARPDFSERIISLGNIKKALGNAETLIRGVDRAPGLTPEQKLQHQMRIYSGMIETAKQGNQIVEAIKKASKR